MIHHVVVLITFKTHRPRAKISGGYYIITPYSEGQPRAFILLKSDKNTHGKARRLSLSSAGLSMEG